MRRNCKKIISGVSTINCGSGNNNDELDCNCSKKPKDCLACDSKCVAVTGRTVSLKFTCPVGSFNAGSETILSGKCKKIPKQLSTLDCNGGGGSGDGQFSINSKAINKENFFDEMHNLLVGRAVRKEPDGVCKCQLEVMDSIALAGNTATAICTNANPKMPTYQLFCDDNGNGQPDEGEHTHTITARKCKKMKSTLSC